MHVYIRRDNREKKRGERIDEKRIDKVGETERERGKVVD
jgi:hypothetical protein